MGLVSAQDVSEQASVPKLLAFWTTKITPCSDVPRHWLKSTTLIGRRAVFIVFTGFEVSF